MNREEIYQKASEIHEFLSNKSHIHPEDADYIISILYSIRSGIFGWSAEIDRAISRVQRLKAARQKNIENEIEEAVYALAGIAAHAANFE